MPHSFLDLWHLISKELKPIEIVAAVTSLICVYLTVKNNIWNWFWGLVGSVLYGYILYKQQLYANSALQALYFVPMQFVGWYVWWKGNPSKNDALPITALKTPARLGWGVVTLALSGLLYVGIPALVVALGQPPPQQNMWDTLTTGMSIVAQYLQTVKRFENWVLWIAADIIYTFIIFPKAHMPITTLLYAVFTVLAIAGAIDWVKIMKKQAQMAVELSGGKPIDEKPLESQR